MVRILDPPPEARKSTAISFESEALGHRHRVIAMHRHRVMGTFYLTAIFRAPFSPSVFSWLEAVNHRGFWSKPSKTISPSGSKARCRKRTRNMLPQKMNKRRFNTALLHLKRKFTARQLTP